MSRSRSARSAPGRRLTERELEILALVASGETTAAIARRLGLAEGTVKTHLTRVYRKTGTRNRVQAARYHLDRHTTDADPGPSDLSLIKRHMAELQTRLDELAPIAAEIERLQDALEALRAIEQAA